MIEYEDYARAGELLGRLTKAVGSGDIMMTVDSRGIIQYRWMLRVAREQYSVLYTLPLRELFDAYALSELATHITDRWKLTIKGAYACHKAKQLREAKVEA